jgi:Fur family ferric uptake transcriptional regulator
MKNSGPDLIEAIKQQGLRITPQRAIIFEAIEKLKGHITAEEVFQEVQQVNAYISLATVYRTLELLRDMNLVTQTNFGHSQAHFALKSHGPHHHLVCVQCQGIEEFSDEIFEMVRQQLLAGYGFEVHTEHMSLFGLCRECRRAQDPA